MPIIIMIMCALYCTLRCPNVSGERKKERLTHTLQSYTDLSVLNSRVDVKLVMYHRQRINNLLTT